MLPESSSNALPGVIGAAIGALLVYLRERRKDADGARVSASADNREWAAFFKAALEVTDKKLEATEAELAAERERTAAAERKAADFERRLVVAERDIAELKRMVRAMGGVPPGETPAHGTPAIDGSTLPGAE